MEVERQPPPYVLSGPVPSKKCPDVWAVYSAAKAAGYPMEFEPGLVLRVGNGGTFIRPSRAFMVMFHHSYHQTFAQASAPDMLIWTLAELVTYLRETPFPT